MADHHYIATLVRLWAGDNLKKEQYFLSLATLIGTFILGLAFIFTQFSGFNELIASGYNFTGPTSNITMSYIYVIAVVHILHVVVGLISLSVTIINHSQSRYSPSKIQGFELAATFWHFIDILWLYLFFFLYFFNKINWLFLRNSKQLFSYEFYNS